MTKKQVKLLRGFRGWETDEVHYPAGTVLSVDAEKAAAMIRDGFARPSRAKATNEEGGDAA